MTDQEIISHLAEKVMGWEVFPLARQNYDEFRLAYHRLVENVEHGWNYFPPGNPGKLWNPLESIAGAFEVQAAVLAGPHANDYTLRMYDEITKGLTVIGTQRLYQALLSATPRQRCLAAVEATR